MWSRLYRNHVIMAFPTYDTVANAWAPQADINWFAGSSHDSKFVQFSKRCTTEEEAVTWALRRSEVWVDNRLRRLSRAILPGRGRGIDMIEAAKSHLGKVTLKQPIETDRLVGRMLRRRIDTQPQGGSYGTYCQRTARGILRRSGPPRYGVPRNGVDVCSARRCLYVFSEAA
jgi:hypothetical protein